MDTTLIEPLEKIGAIFGLPLGWLVLGVTWIVGVVNTAKTLFPNVIQKTWWPIGTCAASVLYAYATLKGWQPIMVGSLALGILAWASWVGAKRGLTALGTRGE